VKLKLKPCPWCGAVPRGGNRLDYPEVKHKRNCYSHHWIDGHVDDRFAEEWNRRHEPPFTPSVPLTMCGHLHAKLPGE